MRMRHHTFYLRCLPASKLHDQIRNYQNSSRNIWQVVQTKKIWYHSCSLHGRAVVLEMLVVPNCLFAMRIYVTSYTLWMMLLLLKKFLTYPATMKKQTPDFFSKHTSSVYSNILIQSPDTDVMLLCIAFASELSNNLYFRTGTGNNTRFVDITSISNVYGVSSSKALLSLNLFTGSDSVGTFKGKGKVKGLKIMLESAVFCFRRTRNVLDSAEHGL